MHLPIIIIQQKKKEKKKVLDENSREPNRASYLEKILSEGWRFFLNGAAENLRFWQAI